MIQFANRLNTVEEYYFSKKLQEVKTLIDSGKPIINMGIGNPDLEPPTQVISAITDSLNTPSTHTYQSYLGIPAFREAIANFYKKKFKVTLNPKNEILPLMGSKEGIMHISLALLNEGDAVLIPNPGYPTYSSVTKLVGATPIYYNLTEENNYQPNFETLEKLNLDKVKLMWVNYPHMPTGAKANTATFEKLIAFGKKHNIVIANDNPYSFIRNTNPKSILQIEGAKNIAIELNSLSKSFNMAGWRVGMLLGNSTFIQQMLKVKTQMDSGMFLGIQKGAIAALELEQEWFNQINKIYSKRRVLIEKLAKKLNCIISKNNTAGMFVWAKLPNNKTPQEMVDYLLYEKNIFVAPGNIFGSEGKNYIRISLCVPLQKIKEAIQRI